MSGSIAEFNKNKTEYFKKCLEDTEKFYDDDKKSKKSVEEIESFINKLPSLCIRNRKFKGHDEETSNYASSFNIEIQNLMNLIMEREKDKLTLEGIQKKDELTPGGIQKKDELTLEEIQKKRENEKSRIERAEFFQRHSGGPELVVPNYLALVREQNESKNKDIIKLGGKKKRTRRNKRKNAKKSRKNKSNRNKKL